MDERRKHPRMSCTDTSIQGAFRLADGIIRELRLVARNVSRGGIAIMHEGSAEPGTACNLVLPTRNGELIAIRGSVRSCRNVAVMIHEIGVEFDDPLDAESFAELSIVE